MPSITLLLFSDDLTVPYQAWERESHSRVSMHTPTTFIADHDVHGGQ